MYRSLKSCNSVRFSIKSHNYSYRVAAILKNGRHFEYNKISDCHYVFLEAENILKISGQVACFLQKVPKGLYICTLAAALKDDFGSMKHTYMYTPILHVCSRCLQVSFCGSVFYANFSAFLAFFSILVQFFWIYTNIDYLTTFWLFCCGNVSIVFQIFIDFIVDYWKVCNR